MKTIKILIPVAMMFAMFIGTNNLSAQGDTYAAPGTTILKAMDKALSTNTTGLYYAKTMVQLNEALITAFKADNTLDFNGKVLITIDLNTAGKVDNISYDRKLTSSLRSSIETTLKAAQIDPVLLNGKPKAQTFKIPVLIK